MAKELGVIKEKGLAEAGFMDTMAGQGYEHMTNEDFSQSFLVILQPLSPQCVKGKDEYMEDAEPGMFYNRGTGQLYSKELKVIPLYFSHEWLEWKPNRGGFCGKHEPNTLQVDKTDYSEWKLENGNIINDTYTFFCALPDHPEVGIVLLSLTSTNIKPAKSWNTMISMVRTPNGGQAPFFSSVWDLSTSKREDNGNTWYTIGKDKANAARERYINQEEYTTLIQPLVEMARNTTVAYEKSGDDTSTLKTVNVDNVKDY